MNVSKTTEMLFSKRRNMTDLFTKEVKYLSLRFGRRFHVLQNLQDVLDELWVEELPVILSSRLQLRSDQKQTRGEGRFN